MDFDSLECATAIKAHGLRDSPVAVSMELMDDLKGGPLTLSVS